MGLARILTVAVLMACVAGCGGRDTVGDPVRAESIHKYRGGNRAAWTGHVNPPRTEEVDVAR